MVCLFVSRSSRSFVVLPGAPDGEEATTFAGACFKHCVSWSPRKGFVDISASPSARQGLRAHHKLVLQHVETDTFTIGAAAVRRLLSWEPATGGSGGGVVVAPTVRVCAACVQVQCMALCCCGLCVASPSVCCACGCTSGVRGGEGADKEEEDIW